MHDELFLVLLLLFLGGWAVYMHRMDCANNNAVRKSELSRS